MCETAELSNHPAIHEDLVNIIDILRHLDRQRAFFSLLRVVLNVHPQSIPRIAGVAGKSARRPSRHKAAVAGDRVIRSGRRRQVHRAPCRVVEVRGRPFRVVANTKFPGSVQRDRRLSQCDLRDRRRRRRRSGIACGGAGRTLRIDWQHNQRPHQERKPYFSHRRHSTNTSQARFWQRRNLPVAGRVPGFAKPHQPQSFN